jgi:tetratricopeptide (TPR) repeat protein
MSLRTPRAAGIALLCASAAAAALPWSVARDSHFEVYAQDAPDGGHSTLLWFEKLRALVRRQTGLTVDARQPVRVIAFHSEADYDPFRLQPTTDAYYVGSGARNYIVLPSSGPAVFRTAAHEYAHFVLNASGLKLPPWLDEGVADLFSTVEIDNRGCRIGGDLAARRATLRRRPWIPLGELLELPADSPVRRNRETTDVFYAESWALTEMLALAPDYAPHFPGFLSGAASGASAGRTLPARFGKSLDAITRDLHNWVNRQNPRPAQFPAPNVTDAAVETAPVAVVPMQLILAEVLLAARQLDRSEALYRELAHDSPQTADVWAGLGAVAMARGDSAHARELWKRALDLGIQDADLCFRYADLLDRAGIAGDGLRSALERAILLDPGLDDARYKLALMDANTGRNEAALAQLRAMRQIAPARAFDYWCTMADVLTGLGRSEEAQTAAHQAAQFATTAEEHRRAGTLAFQAHSHIAVQFARDAEGNTKLVTTRIPDEVADFNPFIEPGDDIRVARGTLKTVDCSAAVLRLSIETLEGLLTVSIPDPSRVLMRHAPAEFTCGPQDPAKVTVEYETAKNVARGIEFQ